MGHDDWFLAGFIVYMILAISFILYCKKKKCFDADLFKIEPDVNSASSVNVILPTIQSV
jgi:hypothetical protein